MKSSHLIILASCLICSLNALARADNHVLVLGSKLNWKPYHVATEYGSDGIAVRAIACIFARMNQPYSIEKKPWARVQHETKNGSLDGFFSASQNAERDSYATLSKVFLPQQRSFYILKKHNINQSLQLEDIKRQLTFAARAGSNALHSLHKKGYPVIVTPKSEQQLLMSLDKQRVGAILENTLVFESLIRKEGRSLDEFYKVPLEEKRMGVYFSNRYLKKYPEFLAKFNNNVVPCSLLPEQEQKNE